MAARTAVTARLCQPVRQIDIVRNNQFVFTQHPLKADVTVEYAAPETRGAEAYYYIRVSQVDDQMAWSSPIWVKVR